MRKHRLLACVMVLAMALSMIPATALAAGSKTADATPDPISYDNGVTLGKTATGTGSTLAQNNKTTVTLSVEEPKADNPVVVEFVLDATESLQLYLEYAASATPPSLDPLTSFVTSMRDQLSNKNIYVGVTVFSTAATTGLEPTLAESISDAMISELVSDTYTFAAERVGTNVQAGIRTGLANLQNSTIAGADRYLVLVTDGGSFFYYNDAGSLIGKYNEAGDTPELVSKTLDEVRDSDGNFTAAADTTFEQAIVSAANEVDTIAGTGVNLITLGFPYYKNTSRLANLTALAGNFVSYAAGRSVSSKIDIDVSSTTELNAAVSVVAG
ncbi:vWA domain-containing protein, partial [Evtepia sp.]|uniref:vWA domain-containing protein n=1 Tax=Evtepia sp. TaxID=2773933 RepID=UPI002A7EF692